MKFAAIYILLLFSYDLREPLRAQFLAAPSENSAASPGVSEPILLRAADSLVVSTRDSQSVRELIGHVHLDHGNVSVFCDHATQFISTDLIVLTGNVKIVQGSVTMFMPRGEYRSATAEASGTGGVRIVDRNMTLTAQDGFYNTRTNQADFHGGVEVQDDTVRIVAKDLRYLRSTQESWLYGHVQLYSKISNTAIVGDSAHNVPATSYSVLRGRPLLVHIDTVASAMSDSLKALEKVHGVADSNKAVPKKSKAQLKKAATKSHEASLNSEKKSAGSTKPVAANPKVKVAKRKGIPVPVPDTNVVFNVDSLQTPLRLDTLTILADVMQSFRAGGEDRYVASRHVEVVRKNLSARCGRCVYDKTGESIDLRLQPQVWADSMQLSGDSIWLHLPNKKLQTIRAYHSAFLLLVDSVNAERAHQIAAEQVFITIDKDTVRAIQAVHDAKSLYFMSGDQGPDGASRTVCDSLFINFDKGQLQNIVWRSGVNSEYYPENMVGSAAHKYYLPTYREAGPRPCKPTVEQRFKGSEDGTETQSPSRENEGDAQVPVQEPDTKP